jgi:hypothetical protein
MPVPVGRAFRSAGERPSSHLWARALETARWVSRSGQSQALRKLEVRLRVSAAETSDYARWETELAYLIVDRELDA